MIGIGFTGYLLSLDSSLKKRGFAVQKSADIMACKIDNNTKFQVEDVKISLEMTE